MKNTHLLVILSDGETFSGIEGARIVEVTDEVLNAMGNDVRYRWIAAGDRNDYAHLKSGIIRDISIEAKIGLDQWPLGKAIKQSGD